MGLKGHIQLLQNRPESRLKSDQNGIESLKAAQRLFHSPSVEIRPKWD